MNESYKILITGGAGFIGSHVADELIKLGHEVVVLDDLSGGFEENINPKAEFVKGSINDHDLINKLFSQHKFDYVFHIAAYAAEGLSHFIKKFNHENNLIGSINLINAAVNHDVKGFVYTSSIAVYGKNQLPMHENMLPQPEDSYGIAKYAVEMELRVTRQLFGLNYIIFRPHNVYGERQHIGDKYRNVLGIFMNQIMQGKSLSIYGDGQQQRAFTYISDVAPIIARSIHEPKAYNQLFNIGSDKPVTVKELAHIVSEAMGVKPDINHLPVRQEVKHAYSDHTRAKDIFGQESFVDIAEGVKKMAEWAKQVGSRETQHFDNIEIQKNLPKVWHNPKS
jgi:UDP-glucose 4-epimerase